MITHTVRYASISNSVVDIDDNTIGFSVEAKPGCDDGFTFGILTEPNIHMNADDGRDFGNVIGPDGFEFEKKGPIRFTFDGTGTLSGAMVILTKWEQDENC